MQGTNTTKKPTMNTTTKLNTNTPPEGSTRICGWMYPRCRK
jgi:hypothetical protein